jgi:hypothetical protein
MAKPQIATRVDEGFYEDFEEFIEERDISKAEGGRILLRDGMEAQEREQLAEEIEELRDQIPMADGGAVRAQDTQLRNDFTIFKQRSQAWFAAIAAGGLYVGIAQSSVAPPALLQVLGIVVVAVLLITAVYAFSRGDSE